MEEPTAASGAAASLWRNGRFVLLWLAGLVSNAGSQITTLALPLTAAITLRATPFEMGALAAASSLPNVLFGLFAGVWVDRVRRTPVLIAADVGRALLLATIPLAAAPGALSFPQLWLVAFATSTLSLFFIIASVAVLPSIVPHDQLVEANSTFAFTDSVLSIAGPSLAGSIIQVLGAPVAVVVDAVSYVLSALTLGRMPRGEPLTPRPSHGQSVWAEIWEGGRALIETPVLRALTLSAMVGTLGSSVQGAVTILFLTRELGLSPALIGLLAGIGGAGALVSAALAGRVGRRLGVGVATIVGNLLWVVGGLATPLAGFSPTPLPYLIVGSVMTSLGATLFSVSQLSLRQQLTPSAVLGRVTAARRFLVFSLAPVGAAAGGVLGTALGLQTTLLIGGAIGLVGVLVVLLSPVRSVRGSKTTEAA
jgi:MFS family permease